MTAEVARPKVFTATSGPLNQRSLPAGRWGRLRYPGLLLEALLAGGRWDEAEALGPNLFVVAARSDWGDLEVLALSPLFDQIADGETAPQYDSWFERQDTGTAKFLRFERIS